MKTYLKHIILCLAFIMPLYFTVSSQPPPPPGSHGSNGNQQSSGGNVPVGSGITILMGMAIAYGARKVFKLRNNED